VAAELGRPVTIIDQEFDAELPSVHEVGSCHHKELSERPFVPDIILQTEMDIQKKTSVYAQFYYSIHLGQIFGQVLSGLHSPRSIQSGRRNHSLVHVLDQRLKNWKLSLPSEMLYDMGDSQQQSANSGKCHRLSVVKPTRLPRFSSLDSFIIPRLQLYSTLTVSTFHHHQSRL
jgi:hypothetical protein